MATKSNVRPPRLGDWYVLTRQGADSLDFPNAPPGTIELIVSEALTSLGRSGVHAATFGGSAVRVCKYQAFDTLAKHVSQPEQIQPMGNEWGMKVKMLTKSYSMITKSFR